MYWYNLLSAASLAEGATIETPGGAFILVDGILRRKEGWLSADQAQTKETFGFKWSRRDSYQNEGMEKQVRAWLIERYLGGDLELLGRYFPDGAAVLDAGCGAGMSALLLMGPRLARIRYLGVDISSAVEVARDDFSRRGLPGEFIQADLTAIPFQEPIFDAIFSEGVLHHTDSTEASFSRLCTLLRPGGYFLFYVYRKKGPVREFTDDYIRKALAPLSDEEAWEALRPLTRLGQVLGELDIEIDVPEDVDMLGIKAGKINVQRLFYWHFCKAYYHREYEFETMNHINFDWYRPSNCHRHTEEEIRLWCQKAGLTIERLDSQESGFTVAARKLG